MHLFLNSDFPYDTVYNDESGALLYKAKTPFKMHNRQTTISRVVDGIPSAQEESAHFTNHVTIDWRVLESNVHIHFGGQELAARDFFRKEGSGWYGRFVHFFLWLKSIQIITSEYKHHIFTAQDGREFKWVLDGLTSKLLPSDSSKTVVTAYNRKKYIPFVKTSKGSIEILPPFEDMLDEIMVTFVYAERLREQEERGN
ncbi:hypothetical protein B0H19DRAFT_1252989 [Mycena capillaripes]|nr:hypothetical protein B0H19DRAFT_1252989 [Mycena capillaripes]